MTGEEVGMAERPKRIQRKRTKGYRLPGNAVYVGRPTKWGNPFRPGMTLHPVGGEPYQIRDAAHAVDLYRRLFYPCPATDRAVALMRNELAGRDLACWCPLPKPGEPDHCHAAVLLELANINASEEAR